MKKVAAKLIIFLFVIGLAIAGMHSCTDDYGDYGDVYGGATSQLP